MHLVTRHGTLHLSGPPVVMGVLNVTPDSFSDAGRFCTVEAATAHAAQMIAAGAAIIDVGPESSRPGAQPVEPAEQLRRAVPVIEAVRRRHPDTIISIDTQSAAVAEAALQAGADIINDITALRSDPEMAALAADAGAPVLLMHMQGTPATMQDRPTYGDVVQEVKQFLSERIAFAVAAGIPLSRLITDPGIGFGKTAAHNGELLRRLHEFVALGPPVLVGASRKSVVRSLVGTDPATVLAGSLMCALAAAAAGVKIVRVHDVGPTVELLRAAAAAIPQSSWCRQPL
ncbi:MAG: dihydropteroate synthase [Planctomycetota bacterium]